jgi:TOBE domain
MWIGLRAAPAGMGLSGLDRVTAGAVSSGDPLDLVDGQCLLKVGWRLRGCGRPGGGSGLLDGSVPDANGVRLVASITVEAARDPGLAKGANVTAVIKASEVILATATDVTWAERAARG